MIKFEKGDEVIYKDKHSLYYNCSAIITQILKDHTYNMKYSISFINYKCIKVCDENNIEHSVSSLRNKRINELGL